MRDVEYVYTGGMTETEVDDRLRSSETGVLSLADGGRAYAVPVSYHYDDGSIFLRLGDDDHSEKLELVETTEEACFVVYGVDEPDESWSVVVTGTLREVPDDDEAYDPTEINERFSSLRVFDEAVDELDVVLYELRISEVTGRRTVG